MEPTEAQILTLRQQALLEHIAATPALVRDFYLTGGTALAGFFLHHRLSEDLDFFSELEVDPLTPTTFLQTVRTELGASSLDFQQSYNRNLYFLQFPDEVLKLEFTYFPFPRIDTSHTSRGISIDSPIDIALNKLFTIYQKPRARDYIDLYCLTEKYRWPIAELIGKARAKFDWHIDLLQLGANFMAALEASDLPHMVVELPDNDWRQFFIEEAGRLRHEVIS